MRHYMLVCVLFHVNVLVTAITNKSSIILCEHEIHTITCKPNSIIKILDGNYGRTSSSVCTNGPIKTVSCQQENTVDILNEICDEKTSCEIHASNSVFGDPCFKTFKYLHVFYECVPQTEFRHEIVCENQVKTLKCNYDNVIEIYRANYGRTKGQICMNKHRRRRPTRMRTINCRSHTSKRIVSEICNKKNSCEISASNKIFGDTCPSTLKYLSIKYKCVRHSNEYINTCANGTIISPALLCNGVNDCPHGEDESVCLTKTTCEHDHLVLECENDFKINIMYATYGRTYANICPTNSAKTDITCYAQKSTEIVKERCNGQNTCGIQAINSVFGDPCPGIEKYLQVKYTCEPDADFNEMIRR